MKDAGLKWRPVYSYRIQTRRLCIIQKADVKIHLGRNITNEWFGELGPIQLLVKQQPASRLMKFANR